MTPIAEKGVSLEEAHNAFLAKVVRTFPESKLDVEAASVWANIKLASGEKEEVEIRFDIDGPLVYCTASDRDDEAKRVVVDALGKVDFIASIQKIKAANDNLKGSALPFKLEMYSAIDPTTRKEWVVRDFLGRGEFSAWYGRPGAGKSVIVGDLACHVAAGWDWFGHKVQGGPVLYVAAERAAVVKRRFAAFRQEHNGKADDLPLAVVSGYVDLCSDLKHATALIQMIAEFEKDVGSRTALVIIDTVNRTLAGGDENGSKEMGSFVAKTGLIQSSTDAHILAIHHPPVDGQQRLRGHGSLLGALDTTVLVRKNSKDRSAIVEKQNDGEEGVKIHFDLKSVTLFEDADGPTTAPVVVPCRGNLAGLVQDQPRPEPRGVAKGVLQSLRAALEQSGEQPPAGSPGFPDDVTVVQRETWRARYFADTDADQATDKDSVRRRFDRAVVALVDEEFVAQVGEWFWMEPS
jgi:hypothetical protein